MRLCMVGIILLFTIFSSSTSISSMSIPTHDGQCNFSTEIKEGTQIIWDVIKFKVSYPTESSLHDNSIIRLDVIKTPENVSISNLEQKLDLNKYFELFYDDKKVAITSKSYIGDYFGFKVGSCDGGICWDYWGGFSLQFIWPQTVILNNGVKRDIVEYLDQSDKSLSITTTQVKEEAHRYTYELYSVYDRSTGIFLEKKEKYHNKFQDGTIISYEIEYKLASEINENRFKLYIPYFVLVISLILIPLTYKKFKFNKPS